MNKYILTVSKHLGHDEYVVCLVHPESNTQASVLTKDCNINKCVSRMLEQNVSWPAMVELNI